MQRMINLVRSFLARPSGRYLAVGGSVYLLEIFIIVVAQGFGASAVTAVTISFWTGLIVSFALQKLFTFTDRRLHTAVVLPQIIAVGLLVLFNYGFTLLLTKLLESLLPVPLIRTIALGITTLWNYYLYRTRIFNRGDARTPQP